MLNATSTLDVENAYWKCLQDKTPCLVGPNVDGSLMDPSLDVVKGNLVRGAQT